MAIDGELQAEQAHVDAAYRRLDQLRDETQALLRSVLDQGHGGTHQFREERDVIVRTSLARLEQLDIGEQALCFGRIDRLGEAGDGPGAPSESGSGGVEVFHIGRLGVSGDGVEPLVVDWRAPVAEPFYRATGREPMGLVLRRHLAARGRQIVGLEDERFARPGSVEPGPGVHGADPIGNGREVTARPGVHSEPTDEALALGGPGALLAALDGARSGTMRDIVATVQAEQDEIIRSPLPGVLVVQGGPGTGKTAVALHRAAYLLYTHRFPLERQGVLVIGPNPLFLRYIEQVLPSLGESGVTLSTVAGLARPLVVRGRDDAAVARLKGEARMATVVARAVRSRQRALVRDVAVPFGATTLRLAADVSAAIVATVRRRPGTHNARRRLVEQLAVGHLIDEYIRRSALVRSRHTPVEPTPAVAGQLALQWTPAETPTDGPWVADGAGSDGAGSDGAGSSAGNDAEMPTDVEVDRAEVGRLLRSVPALTEALDRMWPRLSAEELLHDLFGAPPLVALAAKGILSASEQRLLVRPRSATLAEIPWTVADLALLDEARVWLGPRRAGRSAVDAGPTTYGHIVVDEAQDLSPMQLRMVARRSLSGSITVVGDIGQATGPWAPETWSEVTAHLPDQRPARLTELTVSYRTPAEVVEMASRVLAATLPGVAPPAAVRRTGRAPAIVAVPDADQINPAVVAAARSLMAEVSPGTVAILAASSMVGDLSEGLHDAGLSAADPRTDGLGAPLSLLPVDLANGLEFDAVVVVEPAAVVEEAAQGLRALYVALTRPTRYLTIVHARPLPPALSTSTRGRPVDNLR